MAAGSILCQNKKASFKMSCAGNMLLAYGREKQKKRVFCKIFVLCNEHLRNISYLSDMFFCVFNTCKATVFMNMKCYIYVCL